MRWNASLLPARAHALGTVRGLTELSVHTAKLLAIDVSNKPPQDIPTQPLKVANGTFDAVATGCSNRDACAERQNGHTLLIMWFTSGISCRINCISQPWRCCMRLTAAMKGGPPHVTPTRCLTVPILPCKHCYRSSLLSGLVRCRRVCAEGPNGAGAPKGPFEFNAKMDGKIAALAIPALGTELIDPLLSACDTAFVGRLGVEPLAGVALASSVFTISSLVCSRSRYNRSVSHT